MTIFVPLHHADESAGSPVLTPRRVLRSLRAEVFDVRAGRDRTERALTWSYVALSALDVAQSVNRPAGFHEANPMLTSWAGEQPDAAATVAFKAVVTWGLLRLTRRAGSPHLRKAALLTLNGLQLATVVRNERISGGVLF